MVGIGLAFQNAGDFVELTANFLNHLAGSLGDRFDQHAAEQVGQRSADQRTGQNRGVDDVQLQGVVGSLKEYRKETISDSAAREAEPIAKPLPMAAVVLPTSRAYR